MRGVTGSCGGRDNVTDISTHTPHARRDAKLAGERKVRKFISTHTPHARRDKTRIRTFTGLENFNSHASCEA